MPLKTIKTEKKKMEEKITIDDTIQMPDMVATPIKGKAKNS